MPVGELEWRMTGREVAEWEAFLEMRHKAAGGRESAPQAAGGWQEMQGTLAGLRRAAAGG